MVIYNKLRADIGSILRRLIERKPDCVLLEAEACPDHIHMLIEIPPKYSVSEFMGYLKSKSTLEIFERHAEMKYKFGNRKFWARGYFVDTVGRNEKTIREYIQNQLQEDKLYDQMSMKEFIDPFTGEKVK
jgi:putative transposase